MRWGLALACDCLSSSALCPGVSLRLLSSDWQPFAVSCSAVALYVGDSSDVHLDFAAQVAFDGESECVDLISDSCELSFG